MNVMNIVILDANFLLVPSQYQVDIYNELRSHLTGLLKLIIVPEVMEELRNKSDSTDSTKFRRNVRMALELLKQFEAQYPNLITKVNRKKPDDLSVDDYLVSLAVHFKEKNSDYTIYIATNDKELRTKSSLSKIGTIYMRQKKYLEISK